MICAWENFLSILPIQLRQCFDEDSKSKIQELRLRLNSPAELVFSNKKRWFAHNIVQNDLNFVINAASKYSPWAAATISKGYITAPGGHRIGICGEAVIKEGCLTGIRDIRSLCIRIARDYPGIGKGLRNIHGSILILGPPGSGKTTLLRDILCQKGETEHICVIDERCELFPKELSRGHFLDILTGCPKNIGTEIALRTMSPDCIAVDEITSHTDIAAIVTVANCGVKLMATAHGASIADLHKRKIYADLLENQIFDYVVLLNHNKTYTLERTDIWQSNCLEAS